MYKIEEKRLPGWRGDWYVHSRKGTFTELARHEISLAYDFRMKESLGDALRLEAERNEVCSSTGAARLE